MDAAGTGKGDEEARLAALHRYAVLDTPPEEPFERLIRLAARNFRAPVAFIGLLDARRVWLKARHGLAVAELPCGAGFAERLLRVDPLLLIEDAHADPVWAETPLAGACPDLRFWALAPLRSRDGHVLGIFGVLDREPRRLSPGACRSLLDLAALAVDQLERRRAAIEARRTEAALRRSEARCRTIVEESSQAIVVHRFYVPLFANAAFVRMFGFADQDEVMALPSLLPFLLPVHQSHMAAREAKLRGNPEPSRFEARISRSDNSRLWTEGITTSVEWDGGPASLVTLLDITERKAAEEALARSEARYRAIFELAAVGVARVGLDGRWLEVNSRLCDMLGYPPDELLAKTFQDVTYPDDLEPDLAEVRRLLAGEIPSYGLEKRYVREDGSLLWGLLTVALVRGRDGAPDHFVSVVQDITDRKVAEARVAELAYEDALTGLPNRRLLEERLDQAIAAHRRHGGRAALMLLDLDRFKNVNDTLGHQAGDALLIEVGRRLRGVLRREDTVARLGGDEFAVLIDPLDRPMDAARIARKIVEVLAEPMPYRDRTIHPAVSVGVTLFPSDAEAAVDLMHHADVALYRVKAAGRGSWCFYDDGLRQNIERRRLVESDLRRGLDAGEMLVHYQPLVRLADHRVIGFEALARWHHPERGIVGPDEFLGVADASGLVVPLGSAVLRRALGALSAWLANGMEPGRVAVNVAAAQLAGPALVEEIATLLADAGLPAERLEVEVTEEVLLGNAADAALAVLEELHALGVGVALDDFGTGFASLTRLKRCPVDRIKLDRVFVRGMLTDPEDAAIVRAVVQLGQSLGIAVVAEGVETEAQLDVLRALGCDQAQGYLLASPLPEEAVQGFLAGRRATSPV